jgi:hypothetical protein
MKKEEEESIGKNGQVSKIFKTMDTLMLKNKKRDE